MRARGLIAEWNSVSKGGSDLFPMRSTCHGNLGRRGGEGGAYLINMMGLVVDAEKHCDNMSWSRLDFLEQVQCGTFRQLTV